jgi:hypothetical protein
VWHWKAGRENPVGWVDDKRHIISHKPLANDRAYSLGGYATVYITRLMDQGTSAYAPRVAPGTFKGDIVGSYEPPTPSASLADVRGKAKHDGKTWTLEMSRKFNTGYGDDTVLNHTGDNRCAIAILDDELYWRHSVSPLLILRFVPTNGTDK